jgi:AcrR family transcriptional regulator
VERKADRRVVRTQQLIRGALRSLLEEKGFEALTVQQIIDRANVGRATFYAHFDSKDDLFASGFDELRASLQARQREAFSRGTSVEDRVFAFSHDVFAHANEYRNVFCGMVNKQSGATVQRLLRKLLVDLVRDDVKTTVRPFDSQVLAQGRPFDSHALARGRRDQEATEGLAQFIAGGLFGLLMWWLNGTMRLSVEEINALFRTLAIPTLKAAAR